MTSELLTWYEEGTWPAVVEGTSTAGTATYTSLAARYTRIGRVVFIELYVSWNSGTGTGNLQIGGLPFTASNASTYPVLSTISYNLALSANNLAIANIYPSSTKINIEQQPVGGGVTSSVPYDAAANLQITGFYTV